jgi:hypothetical protein
MCIKSSFERFRQLWEGLVGNELNATGSIVDEISYAGTARRGKRYSGDEVRHTS